jgi:N-acyl-L-homoserine lactone synthetase
MISLRESIAELKKELVIETADQPALVREAYQLRHQVYCVEHKYESGSRGLESDEFDEHSRHAVIRLRGSGQVVGAVRLILPSMGAIEHSFPVQRVCNPLLLGHIPLNRAGEVSRFAISKQRRNLSGGSICLMRLALVQGAVRLSAAAGHTHWLAIMEPRLLRLLRSTGLDFQPVGPLVEHHGIRQPVYANLDKLLGTLAYEYPEAWDFITDGGRWWSHHGRPPVRCVDGAPTTRITKLDRAQAA